MLAVSTGPGRAIARFRDGREFTLRCEHDACDPGPLASALLAQLDLDLPAFDETVQVEVNTGSLAHLVRVVPQH